MSNMEITPTGNMKFDVRIDGVDIGSLKCMNHLKPNARYWRFTGVNGKIVCIKYEKIHIGLHIGLNDEEFAALISSLT